MLWDWLRRCGVRLAPHRPWLPPHPARRPREGCGWAEAAELEWGKPGWLEGPVRLLADSGVDLVVAADCCYIDQDGASPSTPAFVETCAALCGPSTRCLVSFERRAPEVGAGRAAATRL